MNREVQEPKMVKEGRSFGDRYDHPAFATISASRISGQANLFGSNVGHNGFVQIELSEGHLYREAHEDRIYGGKSLARVWMSEAQWVAFISRMNIGSGTPCTLVHAPSGLLDFKPMLPPQASPAEKLDSHVERIDEELRARVDNGEDEVRKLCEGLPAKKRDAILRAVGLMTQHLKANHDFAKKMLTEHKETLVTEAKVEINAMVNGICTQLGVESLQQLAQLGALKSIEHKPEDK